MDIKIVLFLFLLLSFGDLQSQIIIKKSPNFNNLHEKAEFDKVYETSLDISETWSYYEISKRNELDTLYFQLVDNEGIPRPHEHFFVFLDSVKYYLITNERGEARLICPNTVGSISVDIFYSEKKIFLPVSETTIANKTTLVVGTRLHQSILTICSRRMLNYDDIKSIRNQIISGNELGNDDFYYYFHAAF